MKNITAIILITGVLAVGGAMSMGLGRAQGFDDTLDAELDALSAGEENEEPLPSIDDLIDTPQASPSKPATKRAEPQPLSATELAPASDEPNADFEKRLAEIYAGHSEPVSSEALLLYPMNALVNDQLGRLRVLFGSNDVARWFTDRTGRPMKFVRYTGRTLYPGRRRKDTSEHWSRLKQPTEFFTKLEDRAVADRSVRSLIAELRRRGKWPSKPPSSPDTEDGVSAWLGKGKWKDSQGKWVRTVERNEDPELFLRHEAQEGVPDLLVTNYSMLGYMLLRPIEREIFRATAAYYKDNPDQRLLLILDEAHLYQGAQGTEVAMLIRRLRRRLELPLEQLQVICTSASFSNPDAAKRFAADLAGKPEGGFDVLTGTKRAAYPSGSGDAAVAKAFAGVDLGRIHGGDLNSRLAAVLPVLRLMDSGATVESLLSVYPATDGADPLASALFAALNQLPVVGRLINLTSGATAEDDDERDPSGVGPAQDATALGSRCCS